MLSQQEKKLVLSRKGFDSSNGGGPSVVLNDGRMVSLPIPEPRKGANSATYDSILFDGEPISNLITRLGYKGCTHHEAHLDPDIIRESRDRLQGWRGMLGQVDSAESHLRNNSVGEGSLFLFWGWLEFEKVYRKSTGFHCIFGYLEVDFTIDVGSGSMPSYCEQHPHFATEYPRVRNRVYVARDRLSWDLTKPGWGVFRYSPQLQLSVNEKCRSDWQLPICFSPTVGCSVTYLKPQKFDNIGQQFTKVRVPGRGQEFVCTRSPAIDEWALKLIDGNEVWTPR